ncbi:MAG: hypothetical protein K5792_08215 [Butyrivibrio sp.]|nr:hypothetical protein [Butyrivibrio sp.]
MKNERIEKQCREHESQILLFEIGCRKCSNLVALGNHSYMCIERVHMDDSSVIPIRNGKKTVDWNICGGDDYNKI